VSALTPLARRLSRLLGAPSEAERARFSDAASAVDRELAANIELASMWDQTHQAVVFENGEFARHREAIERAAPSVSALLAQAYDGIPATEGAMERRGPANTVRPEDLALIETWEGDVREAQRELRAAATAPDQSLWALLAARVSRRRRASMR
jgi:hypothetical protein